MKVTVEKKPDGVHIEVQTDPKSKPLVLEPAQVEALLTMIQTAKRAAFFAVSWESS